MLKLATKFAPTPSAFQLATEAGFHFAEFWLDAKMLAGWKAIAQLAREFSLQYALHFPNRGDLDDTVLRDAALLYRTLGCSAMVIHQPMHRQYCERLLSHDASIRLAVENHRLSPDEFQSWAEESQWLTLDVEHYWKFTLEDAPLEALLDGLNAFLSRFAGKLAHVHLPGYLPGYVEHRPIYCAREMVFSALAMLADHEFEGLVVSEADCEHQNLHELRMDVLLFERWRCLRENAPELSTTARSERI